MPAAPASATAFPPLIHPQVQQSCLHHRTSVPRPPFASRWLHCSPCTPSLLGPLPPTSIPVTFRPLLCCSPTSFPVCSAHSLSSQLLFNGDLRGLGQGHPSSPSTPPLHSVPEQSRLLLDLKSIPGPDHSFESPNQSAYGCLLAVSADCLKTP